MDFEDYHTLSDETVKDGVQDNFAPRDNDQPFGAFTDAQYLNQSKFLNGVNFFTFAPISLQTYYWTIVRRNLEWYNGYVYGVHNHGVFSSHIGSKICKMAAQLTISGGFRFESEDDAQETFMENWAKIHHTKGKLKQKLPMLNALGFGLAKVDINFGTGELDLSFVQGNRYFSQTDDEKRVESTQSVLKMLTEDVRNSESGNDGIGYYVVEERFYKSGVPKIRYRVYKGPVLATSPVYDLTADKFGVPFEALPPRVQNYVIRRFGKDVLNKTYTLPWDSIGCAILFNSPSATGMDEYGCFSDSTLAQIHEAMYEFDWTKTLKIEHKYLSQDFVAMPDTMDPPKELLGDRRAAWCAENRTGYNKRIVKKMKNADPTKFVPYTYQPQLKTDTYNNDLNQITNEIASGAQFSPTTVAGYLRNGTEKTATEVTADENATRLTIQDKQDLIADALSPLFTLISKHYGYGETEVAMIFYPGALSNPSLDLDMTIKKLQNNLTTPKLAVQEANKSISPKEAEKIAKESENRTGGRSYYPEQDLDGLFPLGDE